MAGALSYNSNSLQTANIVTSNIDHHSAPDRKLNMAAIAYANRSKITNSSTSDRTIIISGMLVADSIEEMDVLEDTFKGIFIGEDGNLDIEHSDTTRRYIATPGAPKITREDGLAYAYFEVRFTCAEPFGIDIAATQLDLTAGYTSPTRLIPITIVGNAEFQHPITQITLVDGTQLSNGTISIGNNANGQVLNITRDWEVGNVLEIDHYTSEVKVDNVEVEFTGAIPVFKPGSQNMTYEDSFLTRDVDFDIQQYGRWM